MKRFILMIISLVSILMLSSCGNINIGTNTIINENSSGKFTLKVVYDAVVASTLKNSSILNSDGNVVPKGEQVRKYMKGNDYAEDYIVNFKDLQSLNRKFSANKDMKISVKEHKGFIHNTYTYEMRFTNGFKSSEVKTNSTNQEAVSNADTKAGNDYINSIPFINQVTLPGTLISTNAIEKKGNNLVWTYSLGQLTPNTIMTATYNLYNRQNIIMLSVIGIFAVIVALISLFIIIRRRRVK